MRPEEAARGRDTAAVSVAVPRETAQQQRTTLLAGLTAPQRRARRRRRAAVVTLAAASALAMRWFDANQSPVLPLLVTSPGITATMTGPNAGHFYAAAADALRDASGMLDPNRATLAEQRDAVTQDAAALALLRQGFRYEFQGDHTRWLRSEVPAGFATPEPNFTAQRTLARLLVADAHVKAAHGDAAGAMAASLDAVRFGRDIAAGDHGLIGGMIGSLSDGLGSEEALRHVDALSARDARAAARRLEAMQAQEIRLADSLLSEERFGLGAYREVFDGSQPPAALLQMDVRGFPSGLYFDALVLRYGRQGLVNNYAEAMDQAIRRAALPYPQARHLPRLPEAADPLDRSLIPNTERAQKQLTDRTAQSRILLTRLALQAYRQEHGGAVPARLSDLTTSPAPYLRTVPADPFSPDGTAPLRYANGRAYSVGENGRDDGGSGDDTPAKG